MPKRKQKSITLGDVIKGLTAFGAVASLIAQIRAPNCPDCGTKTIFINNYCIRCGESKTVVL